MSPPKNGEIPRNRFPDRFGTAKPAIRTAVAPKRQKVKGLLRVSSWRQLVWFAAIYHEFEMGQPVPPRPGTRLHRVAAMVVSQTHQD
jgi:hypothetical protein